MEKHFPSRNCNAWRRGSGYRLCGLGDMNGWIGERMTASITDANGVPGENEKGRRVVEFCAERGQCCW